MVSYPECPRNSGTMADRPKRDSKRAILVVLPAVGETQTQNFEGDNKKF